MKVRPCILLHRNAPGFPHPEILLLRYRYGKEDVYALPGGNPDKGETLPETVVRELKEELGVTVVVGTMLLCGEVILKEAPKDVLHVVFQGQLTTGTPRLNPAETTALEIVWQSIDALDTLNLYPNVGKAIQRWFTDDAPEPGYLGRISQRYF